MFKKTIVAVISIILISGVFVSTMAEDTQQQAQIMKLAKFIGTWDSKKGPPTGPKGFFRNVYEWGFDRSIIRVKTYLVTKSKDTESQKLMYETVFAWSPKLKSLVSIGFGANTFEESIIQVDSTSGEVKLGFKAYHGTEAPKMRFIVSMAKSGQSFDHKAYSLQKGKYTEVFASHWTRKN